MDDHRPDIYDQAEGANQYSKLGYGPVLAVVGTVATYGLSQFLAAMVVVLPLIFMGWDRIRVSDLIADSVPVKFVLLALVSLFTIFIISKILAAVKTSFKQIGWVRFKTRDIGYAILAFVGYYVAFIFTVVVAKTFIPGLDIEQEQNVGFDKNAQYGLLLPLIFASLVLLPAFVEEILCRGFLFSGLRKKLPFITSAIITSLIFGLLHLQWGSGAALLWVAALDTFVLSMFLVYLREKTGSLWSPILVHMFKNGLAFSVLFIFN